MKRILLAVIAGVIFANLRPVATAAEYRFTNIADTTMSSPSGPFTGFGFSTDGAGFYNNPLAISGDRVAFHGSYQGGEGVFVGSGGTLTPIAKSGDEVPMGTFDRFSYIGISGMRVAFLGRVLLPGPDDDGIFSGNGGPLEAIGAFGEATFPAIGDDAVAYEGFHLGSLGIWKNFQGSTTPIVLSGAMAPSGEFVNFRDPSIDNGRVAFTGFYSGGHGVFSSSGEIVTTIAKVGDNSPAGVLTSTGGASISEGKVAFLGRYGGGGPTEAAVFIGGGGPLTLLAKGGDLTDYGALIGFDAPAISHDTVAFHARWNGGNGILVWNEGGLQTAIKTGDTLFGSTLVNIGFRRFGLDPDGSGNLAFAYVLADGRLGVALAKPVPEPSALAMTVFAFLALIRFGRQRIFFFRCNS